MKRLSKLYSKRLSEANDEFENEDGNENRPEGQGGVGGGTVWKSFGVDLTEEAREGRIDPVIGREKELDQVLLILARKTKDNPVLIGEPGVGKTAVVEKLALLMASPQCPNFLKGTSLLMLNLNQAMSSPAWGQLLEEIESEPLILFMDEIHSLSEKLYDPLKPLLARRQLHLIGASTLGEYRNSIEKDGAMERRFQKVMVNEPSYEECMEILRGIQNKYEQFHNVKYTEEALESFYKLSQRYITDRFLPDKAIDLMDETGAKIRMSAGGNPKALSLEETRQDLIKRIESESKKGNYDLAAQLDDDKREIESQLTQMSKNGEMGERVDITRDMAEELVAKKTGIPVQTMKKSDKASLKELARNLKAKVIGQDDAVDTVVKTVRRNSVGLKDPNRPGGVFLFVGPTGTGKTYLVKKLAEEIFGSEKAIIRFDMAEFAAEHEGSKLIGAPPGFVGYGQGGQLTEKVRRQPYSLILLDEIEKASKTVLQSLLGVFEDGRMTDGEGRTVDFKNTVIIMTSNAGMKPQEDPKSAERTKIGGFTSSNSEKSGGGETKEQMRERILQALKTEKKFSPEFLNRIDDIVIFQPISEEAIKGIATAELQKVSERLKDTQKIELVWGNSVYKLLVKYGFDPSMGARPMKRAIRRYIEDPIASYLIEDDVEEGTKIKVDYDVVKDELVINGKHLSEIVQESNTRFVQKKFSLFESNSFRRVTSFSEFKSSRINEAEPARQPEKEEEKETPYKPQVPTRPKRDPKPLPPPDPGPKPERKPNPRPSHIPLITPPGQRQGPVAKTKKPNEMDVVKRYLRELRMRKK